jgi:hypothetical protein
MGTAIIDARGSLVSISTLTPPVPPIISGNFAYYKLDNNGSGEVSLVDSTGNGNTLLNSNGVTLGTGKIGSGSATFSFENFLSLSSFPALGTGNFSFATWIRPVFAGGYTSIASNRPYDIASLDYFAFGNLGDSLYFYNEGFVSNNSGVLVEGVWQHLAVVKVAGMLNMYLNGNLISSDADAGNYISSTLYIGANGDGSIYYSGDIDEHGIWNRALTANQVLALYNAGAGLTYPFTN